MSNRAYTREGTLRREDDRGDENQVPPSAPHLVNVEAGSDLQQDERVDGEQNREEDRPPIKVALHQGAAAE